MNYTLKNGQKKIPGRKHGRIVARSGRGVFLGIGLAVSCLEISTSRSRIEDDGWIDKALERAIAVIDNPLREVRRDSRSKKR